MKPKVASSAVHVRALERVRSIVLDVLDTEDVRVYLFGSCATGSPRATSDIDVAIEPLHGSGLPSLAELRERLEDSDVPYDVDVVDLSTVSPEFAQRVRLEGIVWKG